MKYCSNSRCLVRQQNDGLAEYHDSLEVCPECGASLTSNIPIDQKLSHSLWKRTFISLGVLAVCLAARQIPLPTVIPKADFGDGSMAGWSIMALGVGPLLSGYLLVEFAALIVPAWRPLRVGGPAGRAKLHRAALITGMVLALPQALVFTIALETTGVTRNYDGGFRVITVLTLVGATGALVALARILDREGLGGGFSILLLANLVPQIVGPLGARFCMPHRVRSHFLCWLTESLSSRSSRGLRCGCSAPFACQPVMTFPTLRWSAAPHAVWHRSQPWRQCWVWRQPGQE